MYKKVPEMSMSLFRRTLKGPLRQRRNMLNSMLESGLSLTMCGNPVLIVQRMHYVLLPLSVNEYMFMDNYRDIALRLSRNREATLLVAFDGEGDPFFGVFSVTSHPGYMATARHLRELRELAKNPLSKDRLEYVNREIGYFEDLSHAYGCLNSNKESL